MATIIGVPVAFVVLSLIDELLGEIWKPSAAQQIGIVFILLLMAGLYAVVKIVEQLDRIENKLDELRRAG